MKMISTAAGHVACLNIDSINNQLGVILSHHFIANTLMIPAVHTDDSGVFWRVEDVAKIRLVLAVRLMNGSLHTKHKLIAEIDYTNHKGRRAVRTITPLELTFGGTEFHPEPQWLLRAFDHEKNAERTFSMAGVHEWKINPT